MGELLDKLLAKPVEGGNSSEIPNSSSSGGMIAALMAKPVEGWEPTDPYRIDFNQISGPPTPAGPPPTAGDKARQATLMGGAGFAEGVSSALTGFQELPQTIIQATWNKTEVERSIGRKANEILDAFWAAQPGLSPSEAASGINALKDELVQQNGDPQLADSFLWSKLPRGAGNLLFYLTGGVVGNVATGGAAAASTLATAIPTQVGSMFEEAKAAGKTTEEARAYALVGIPIGASELAGIPGKFLRVLSKAPATLQRAIKTVVEGGLENAVQEVGQTVAENAAAAAYIDKNRDIFEGVGDAAGQGGTLGVLASAAAAAFGMRRTRIMRKAAETGQVTRAEYREAMGVPSSEEVPANAERVADIRERLAAETETSPAAEEIEKKSQTNRKEIEIPSGETVVEPEVSRETVPPPSPEAAQPPPLPDGIPAEQAAEDTTLTSARQAWIQRDRAALMHLDGVDSPDKRAWAVSLAQASERGYTDKTWAQRESAKINESPRPMDDIETAGMTHVMAQLKLEHKTATKMIGETTDPAQVGDLAADITRIEQEYDSLSTAVYKSGTEKGRALASQKLTLADDFSLIAVLANAKAKKGAELTPSERSKFEKTVKELEAKVAELESLRPKSNEEVAKQAIGEHKAGRKGKARVADAPTRAELADKVRNLLEQGC